MWRLPIYQVDAFTDRVFAGNPAAVVPLDRWLPDGLMQSIAAENNLSETAFFVANGDDWDLRWFTPAVEVNLCGHATLATAWVIWNRLDCTDPALRFHTRSGLLTVRRDGDALVLDLPAQTPQPCPIPAGLAEALGATPTATLKAADLMAVFDDPALVAGLRPDLDKVARLQDQGIVSVVVTAPGSTEGADFVSRCFAPAQALPEDPVTGSTHCALAPYWAERLGKTDLLARQVSARGGDLRCRVAGDRVLVSGRAAPYLEGTIRVCVE